MNDMGHEQVVFCSDSSLGLKAIIAIHNTSLGPSLGGVRMWPYESEENALNDVLRLSKGMTYKAAVSGLSLGGGKAVIIGDPRQLKNEQFMRRFGEFVDSLGGKYITAEDVNMTVADMKWVAQSTKHVTGLPEEAGGSGDPSPVTAYTTYLGMKASCKKAFGSDSLHNKKVLVQGVGNVGSNLLSLLHQEGAQLYISDLNESKVASVLKAYNAKFVSLKETYEADVDVYAPCALGATINDNTIPVLKCKVIAGAANNQLLDETVHGNMLLQRGIVHAPDFLINSGGLINVYAEYKKRSPEQVKEDTQFVYNKTLEILNEAERLNQPPQLIAIHQAEKRIEDSENVSAS